MQVGVAIFSVKKWQFWNKSVIMKMADGSQILRRNRPGTKAKVIFLKSMLIKFGLSSW